MRTYDLVVIGGGTAGLTAAVGAASQGARTVLVERDRTGGDCLWTGCVPSKALLTVAERAHIARTSAPFGVHAGEVRVDLAAAMAHVKDAIATIEPHDSPERLRREGVEVVHGTARFDGPDSVTVDGRRLGFRRAMIATGAAPHVPDLPGLRASDPLTSQTLWDLTELPGRLVVLGCGPIGVELGQAFARLGSTVTLVEMADTLLPQEEPEASEVVAAQLAADGIEMRLGTRAVRVEEDGDGARRLVVARGGVEDAIGYDQLLVATGRRPNTDGLGLDAAGVEVDRRHAVVVDDRLRTTNPRVFAGGDVTLLLPFTHTAAAHGAAVVQNALFGLRARVDRERIPWVTFSDPEVARIGLTAEQARARFGRATVRTARHAQLDRAVTAGQTAGFARLVGDRRGRIVGATVVGPRAGETIGEVAAWMANGAKVSRIVRTTHAYPTWNGDLAAASLEDLRASLARVRPLLRTVLWLRRRLGR
jgi:pyruvate/2-oxoglutarate dehydrogenase complex dihydrolipoamide dehydrogenase (E3) component